MGGICLGVPPAFRISAEEEEVDWSLTRLLINQAADFDQAAA